MEDARQTDGVSDPRFRNPGYERLRALVREIVVRAGVLDESEALVLIAHGLTAAARNSGVSDRTVRRRFEAAGTSVRRVVHQTRVEATVRACGAGVPTTVVARWLGFTSPDAYRRFVKRELGVSIKKLRPRVRESAVFLVLADECHPAAPLSCSKIASVNLGVKDLSTVGKACANPHGVEELRNE